MSPEFEDVLLASLARRNWLVDGLLKPVVTPYIHHLRAQRYADNSIRSYLKAVAHFSYWASIEHIKLSRINEVLIDRFIHSHLPVCDCPAPCPRYIINALPALKQLITVLRQQGHPCKMTSISTPVSREIIKFRHYLIQICGFAEASTVHYRLKHVSDFLEQRFGTSAVNPARLTPLDIEACVMNYSSRWRPASLGVIRASIKSYLKFRTIQGDETRHLIAALPVPADWSHATLPKALSEDQLGCFVKAFDVTKPIGQRDYAIARCLIDLGLRGCEVANLEIESFDWQNGILTVIHSKDRRIRHLPLPWQTGEAIANYLRHGRPATTSRILFVHHKAPVGTPLHVAGIRGAMRYAFERCGMGDQFCSTHALRHTVAVRLQRSGASIKDIADLLGHQSLQSTMSYARVDVEKLRAVSLSWPGSKP